MSTKKFVTDDDEEVVEESNVTTEQKAKTMEDQMADYADQILNRKQFAWDPNESMDYQNYKTEYENQANMAKEAAIAATRDAAAGWGSSYAALAGNMAYNEKMSGLDADAYNLAKADYDAETEDLQTKYNAAATQNDYLQSKLAYEQEQGNVVTQAYQGIKSNSGYDEEGNYVGYTKDLRETYKSQLMNGAFGTALTEEQAEQVLQRLDNDNISYNNDYLNSIGDNDITNLDTLNALNKQYDSDGNRSAAQNTLSKALTDLSKAYDAFGYTQEEWQQLSEENQMTLAYEKAGELHKDGLLSDDYYYNMIRNNVKETIQGLKDDAWAPGLFHVEDVLDVAVDINTYMEKGYIDRQTGLEILNDMAKQAIDLGLYFKYVRYNSARDDGWNEKFGITKGKKLTEEQKELYHIMFDQYQGMYE